MICKYCGTEIKEKAESCPQCGKQLMPRKKRKVSTKKRGLLILLCIIGIAILTYMFWQTKRGQEEKQIVSGFLDAYVQLDEKQCKELMLDEEATMDDQGLSNFQREMAKRLTYRITGFSEGEGYSIVEVEITNVDFQKIMDTILESGKTIDEERFEQTLQKMISDSESPKRKFECEVNVFAIDGKSKIEITESLSNALLGGLPEYIASVVKEI